MFDFKTKFPSTVAIMGAARSGLAAAKFLMKHGVTIFISDSCNEIALRKLLDVNNLGSVGFEAGGHTKRILDNELIILSPGIPSDLPVLNAARQQGVEVWSEIELAFLASRANWLAITGSSGKSTTVSLLGAAIAAAQKSVTVAGNIGLPLSSVAPDMNDDAYIVAEVSSFQLETINSFHPHVAAVLNFMKNHLDRYPDENAYYAAKKEIAKNLNVNDYLVLNGNDPLLVEWGESIRNKVKIILFGKNSLEYDCVWNDKGVLRYRFENRTGVFFEVSKMQISGPHNYDNASVAAIMAKAVGIDDQSIASGITGFKGLAHRLEFVATVNGVSYYNDSKSTTAESITCAVSSFDGGVHLIAGGRDKGCDFTVVNDAIKKFVKKVHLIGEASDRIETIWKNFVPIQKYVSLDTALNSIFLEALAGETVVFSPGCSSFDMFKNFEERGDVFKKLVLDLRASE